MSIKKLLPCPFCGNEVKMSSNLEIVGVSVVIECKYCNLKMESWDENCKAPAIEKVTWKWNRRM